MGIGFLPRVQNEGRHHARENLGAQSGVEEALKCVLYKREILYIHE
jgi:hypothetical protein